MHEQQNYFPLLRSSSPDRALLDCDRHDRAFAVTIHAEANPANMLQEGVRFSYYSKGEPDGYVISLNRKRVKSFRGQNYPAGDDPAL